jgi:hypothetical protein
VSEKTETDHSVSGILQILVFCTVQSKQVIQAQEAEQHGYCLQHIEMFNDYDQHLLRPLKCNFPIQKQSSHSVDISLQPPLWVANKL